MDIVLEKLANFLILCCFMACCTCTHTHTYSQRAHTLTATIAHSPAGRRHFEQRMVPRAVRWYSERMRRSQEIRFTRQLEIFFFLKAKTFDISTLLTALESSLEAGNCKKVALVPVYFVRLF